MVTGGGRGVGRAQAERLLGDEDTVVAIEVDPAALAWTESYPRAIPTPGDASDVALTERAADLAQAAAPLAGWVNNAAVFRDASIHSAPTAVVLDLIALNLNPCVVDCATAIRRFLAAGTAGAIVNVSSHQARRAVPGALPYVTAEAAIEGLTRALAVEYGPRAIGVNAVALGSIATERFEAFLGRQEPAEARADRGRDASAASGRPGGTARGGCGRGRPPALRRGELHHRRRCPSTAGSVLARDPEARELGP